jgi:ribosomal protein S18 acetylase RimI-like enzyme
MFEYRFDLANNPKDFSEAATLFKEYAASLNFDLCFQNFDTELNEIDVKYNSPHGGLILIRLNNESVGCAAVRKLEDKIGELKRMYIQPGHRGLGLGHELLKKALEMAKALGYETVRLDTIKTMTEATRIYERFGFVSIPPYCYNPMDNALYLEKRLV